MVVGDDVVLSGGELGTTGDWVANVLGQRVFGRESKSFVSFFDGVSKAVVKLPPVPVGATASDMAGLFRAASGIAMRNAYTIFDDSVSSSVDSVSSADSFRAVPAVDRVGLVSASSSEDSVVEATGSAGEFLAVMNDVVSSRLGVGGDSQIASGCCYEVLFKQSCRQGAVARLRRWPILRELLEVPYDWYADSDSLQRIGVSVRAGNLHFQAGWGDGVLTALDIITVGRRSKVSVTVGLGALLDMKVGGESVDNHGDCRASILRELGVKHLAVWGSTGAELQASPGWDRFVASLGKGVDVAVRSAEVSSGVVCSCWYSPPSFVDRELCGVCGFMVKMSDHADRCIPVTLVRVSSAGIKSDAWVGDALHHLDVRRELLDKMPYVDAVRLLERYTAGAAQHAYMCIRGDSRESIALSSDWFECNYLELRGSYRLWLRDDIDAYMLSVSVGKSPARVVHSSVYDDGGGGVSIVVPEALGEPAVMLDDLSSIVKADDKMRFAAFVRDLCLSRDFVLLEVCVQGVRTHDVGMESDVMLCKPTKPGCLDTEVFESLVVGWFGGGCSLDRALSRFIRGRAIGNVSKKCALRCLRSACDRWYRDFV